MQQTADHSLIYSFTPRDGSSASFQNPALSFYVVLFNLRVSPVDVWAFLSPSRLWLWSSHYCLLVWTWVTLFSCHSGSPNRSRPGLYDIESMNGKWKMEPISSLLGYPWGQTSDFTHLIDQFFGYWIAQPEFVKKYYHQARVCSFTFLTHRSAQPLPLPHFPSHTDQKCKMASLGTHTIFLDGVGSDCFEFSPGLLLPVPVILCIHSVFSSRIEVSVQNH